MPKVKAKSIDDLQAELDRAKADLEKFSTEQSAIEAELARLNAGLPEIESRAERGAMQDLIRTTDQNLKNVLFDVQRAQRRLNQAQDDLNSAKAAQIAERMDKCRAARDAKIAEALTLVKAARDVLEDASEEHGALNALQSEAGVKLDDWERASRMVNEAVIARFGRHGLGRYALAFSRAHFVTEPRQFED